MFFSRLKLIQSITVKSYGDTLFLNYFFQLPQAQMLVMERLHSGARHHVVLDFGCIVQLTDILIPSCAELSSLSIDVWIRGEEQDAQRIAVVPDIDLVNCVLKDLLPPPLCQYVKVRT